MRTDKLIDGLPIFGAIQFPGTLGDKLAGNFVRDCRRNRYRPDTKDCGKHEDTFTVDASWRGATDSTSKLALGPGYIDNIIYKNTFTAAPAGFHAASGVTTASIPFKFDGDCWNNVAEANNYSVPSGAVHKWTDGSQSYWNVFRDNVGHVTKLGNDDFI